LAAYRLIAPGSEWRLHRQRFDQSAMADLLRVDSSAADPPFGEGDKRTFGYSRDKRPDCVQSLS